MYECTGRNTMKHSKYEKLYVCYIEKNCIIREMQWISSNSLTCGGLTIVFSFSHPHLLNHTILNSSDSFPCISLVYCFFSDGFFTTQQTYVPLTAQTNHINCCWCLGFGHSSSFCDFFLLSSPQ